MSWSVVGFVLGLAVIGAMAAIVAAALVAVALPAVVALTKPGSARRADLALLGGLLPAVTAVVGMALVAVPSLLAVLTVAADHCLQHDHHGHLCPVHLQALSPWLAVVGGAVIAAVAGRMGVRLGARARQRRLVLASSLIGEHRRLDDGTTLVVLDGPPTLLHAADHVVVASKSLLDGLSARSVQAALAHEAAHVHRGDSRWLHRLSMAAALSPPLFGAWMQRLYRQAAEEAADEAAAVVVGAVDVAAAVVEVSRVRLRLQRQALVDLPAIDGGDLTARIERLLATEPRARRSGAPVVVATLLLASLAVAPFFDHVHHLAETALAQVERPRHQHGPHSH